MKIIETHRNGDGLLHREGGPARIWDDGSQDWWINGRPHRENGPASICASGNFWRINGKRHREDGPAVEWYDGSKQWFINGNEITNEVEEWITTNNIPDYKEWTNKEKALFKLKFLY